MNDDRRKKIAAIATKLDELRTAAAEIANAIEEVRDEEQEYFDNMPESFQQGDKGNRAEEVISYLDDAHGELETVDSVIDEAISRLSDAEG